MSGTLLARRIGFTRQARVATACVAAVVVAAVAAPHVQPYQAALAAGFGLGFGETSLASLGVEPGKPAKGVAGEVKEAFGKQLAKQTVVALGKGVGHVAGPIFRAWADAWTQEPRTMVALTPANVVGGLPVGVDPVPMNLEYSGRLMAAFKLNGLLNSWGVGVDSFKLGGRVSMTGCACGHTVTSIVSADGHIEDSWVSDKLGLRSTFSGKIEPDGVAFGTYAASYEDADGKLVSAPRPAILGRSADLVNDPRMQAEALKLK